MPRPLLILGLSAVLLLSTLRGADPRSARFLLELRLQETPADLQRQLGPPAHVSNRPAYLLWEYQFGPGEREVGEYEIALYFGLPERTLLTATRNFPDGINVDGLFPSGESRAFTYTGKHGEKLSARARLLEGERILIAIGATQPGDLCHQLVLLRRDALPRFYPWIQWTSP